MTLTPPESMNLVAKRSWMCDRGYPVGNPMDSNPNLCGAGTIGKTQIALWETTDHGKTWKHVGWWKQAKLDEVGQFSQLEWLPDLEPLNE